MEKKVRIKLNSSEENKVKGFFLLATSGNTCSTTKDEFVVPKKAITLLKKEDIHFDILPLA